MRLISTFGALSHCDMWKYINQNWMEGVLPLDMYYSLRSLLIVLFHLDTITKEKQPCLSSNKCNTRFFTSPPMSLLETPRYWCYLLTWSLSIENMTIICEYLNFKNSTIKRKWREYYLLYLG